MQICEDRFERIFQLDDVTAKYLILDHGHILKVNQDPVEVLSVYKTDGNKIFQMKVNSVPIYEPLYLRSTEIKIPRRSQTSTKTNIRISFYYFKRPISSSHLEYQELVPNYVSISD